MEESTKQLTKDLFERKSITSIEVDPYEEAVIKVGQKETKLTGPAVIIINQD